MTGGFQMKFGPVTSVAVRFGTVSDASAPVGICGIGDGHNGEPEGVQYGCITPVAVGVALEKQRQIETLQDVVDWQQDQIEALLKRVDALEKKP